MHMIVMTARMDKAVCSVNSHKQIWDARISLMVVLPIHIPAFRRDAQ